MARIAWIDDDYYGEMDILVESLRADGHTVLPFGSMEDIQKGIDVICSCDAVILDIILPKIKEDPFLGMSVLKSLRQSYGYQKPIMIYSGVRDEVMLQKAKEWGATVILKKFVDPVVFRDAVTDALKSVKS